MSIQRKVRKLKLSTQMLTPRKLCNLFIKEMQISLGHSHLLYYPNRLTVDIGNVCNLRCPLCPTGRGDKGASKGFMKFQEFKSIIDDLGMFLTHLELHNWGEPLLNKDLVEMVQYAKHDHIPTVISTNLNILDKNTAEALIATRIDKILISCDGTTQETYSMYRVGGDFNKVISNIHLLLDAKKKLKNDYTSLRLLFHVFKYNEHEIENIRKLAKNLNVDVLIDPMRTDMGKEIFERVGDAIERDKAWIPENQQYSNYNLNAKDKKRYVTCSQPWKMAMVNWDGSVLPCCHIYGEQHAFGNVFREKFFSIWNNEKYVLARKEILNKIEKSPTICHMCKENGFPVF